MRCEYILNLTSPLSPPPARPGSGQRFCSDGWARGEGAQGYGITRVLEGGSVLEKAACNVSVVHGTLDPQRAAAMSSRGRPGVDPAGGQPYSAVALSLVFHSASPLLPTFRADVRCFEVAGAGRWFGGGADLTPFYLFDEVRPATGGCLRHGSLRLPLRWSLLWGERASTFLPCCALPCVPVVGASLLIPHCSATGFDARS